MDLNVFMIHHRYFSAFCIMQSRHFLTKKIKQNLRNALAGKPNQAFTRPSPNESTCPICLDPCEEVSTIDSCKHVFCFPCISAWGKITPRCPLCKLSFEKAICAATLSNPEKVFKTQVFEQPPDEIDEDILDLEEDHDDSSITFGYEMDGFVVSEESVDYDFDEEISDSDRILDRADEVLLRRKRRKLVASTPEVAALPFSAHHHRRQSHDSGITYTDAFSHRNQQSSASNFESFLISCELKPEG
jgi:Ring finger domain